MPLQPFFLYSPADDVVPVGSVARFGFVSMVRLNLALSLARRGVVVDSGTARDDGAPGDDADRGSPTFGKLLRSHRLAAGLSQEALAERARISVNGLGALERGERRTPQRETLSLLVQALALTPEDREPFEAAARRETRGSAPREAPADVAVSIDTADVLIVVLTAALLADDGARAQLARFAERTGASGRIVVVRRTPFAPESPIDVLVGRPTCDFFRSAAHARPFEPLYRNDGTPLAAFYDVVESLAEMICRPEPATPSEAVVQPADVQRTVVYVAPPASDMESSYRMLVAELDAAGYDVAPKPGDSVRCDEAGIAAIDRDLARAVTAIHLLGETDDADDAGRSRLALVLARAAARAIASEGEFNRVIFAPRIFAVDEAGSATLERDPIAVRDRFATPLSDDTIVGDGIIDFVLVVKEMARIAERRSAVPAVEKPLPVGSAIFVNFHPEDVAYARALAKALRERGMRSRFAAFEDDKVQNKITNATLAKEADAVVHCWANATDAWLYAEAADYEDWRKLGRSQPFRTRAAVAGPPERGSKMLDSADSPPDAIDVYVDLTTREVPEPEDLDPLVAFVEPPRPS